MKIVGAHSNSLIGLAKIPKGHFECGNCQYFDRGVCHNPNPALHKREVDRDYCCNLFWCAGMKVIR